MKWATEAVATSSGGETTPSSYQASSQRRSSELYGGCVGQSDGFLDMRRNGGLKQNGVGGYGGGGGGGGGGQDIPARLNMMRSINNNSTGKTKKTSESAWKIYQQLKVSKQ